MTPKREVSFLTYLSLRIIFKLNNSNQNLYDVYLWTVERVG